MIRLVKMGTFVISLMMVASVALGQSEVMHRVVVHLPKYVLDIDPRAHDYNRISSGLMIAGMIWDILGFAMVCRLQIAPRVRDWAKSKCRHPLFVQAAVFAAITFCLVVWKLPVGFAGYLHERNFGFARHNIGLWMVDHGRGWLIGLFQVPGVWIGYWLVNRSPKRWWIWLTAVLFPAQIVMAVLWPVLVAPSFNHFTPLPEGTLKRKLIGLAERAGVGKAEALVADVSKRSSRINAYVAGIGPTKRIVIWDNTLRTLTEDEVVAIVAHELGHYRLGHIWIKVLEGTFGAFVLLAFLYWILPRVFARYGSRLGATGANDIGGLPLVFLVLQLLLFIQMPLANYLSRMHEREADHFGLELNRDGMAMIKTYGAFVKRDFADADPPTWVVFLFYSHPQVRDRIRAAEDYIKP